MLRHPAEPYLPFVVGWHTAREQDEDTIPWIEATLERAQVYGPAHLVLARFLAKRARAQARLEYRLAFEQGPELIWAGARETSPLVGSYYDAIELAPAGPFGAIIFHELVGALGARFPATSVRLDAEIALRTPTDPGPSLDAARAAVEDLESTDEVPWCSGAARVGCVKFALDSAARAQQFAPSQCDPYVLHARVRIADGNVAKGLSELATAAETVSDRVPCLEALVDLADRSHDDRRASAAMAKIASSGCSDDGECSQNLAWIAGVEERKGNSQRALVFYKRAYDRSPDNDELLQASARLAASIGLHSEAEGDYERLARRHPEQSEWRTAAAQQRVEALRAASER